MRAKALVNAAGPWVSDVLGGVVGRNDPDKIRLVKGSHIVVDKLFDHDRCYIFQNADGRICFAIPYEQNFTLIGTTDEDYQGDPGSVADLAMRRPTICCAAVSEYFKQPVTRDEVRWTYSGVRPLYDDGAIEGAGSDARLRAEARSRRKAARRCCRSSAARSPRTASSPKSAMEKIEPFFPQHGQAVDGRRRACPAAISRLRRWSSASPNCTRKYSFLQPRNVRRLFRAYGTDAEKILGGARFAADMGQSFGPLTEREIDWLKTEGMGPQRRRHPVAALEAGASHEQGRAGRVARQYFAAEPQVARASTQRRGMRRSCRISFSPSTRARPRRGPSSSTRS